MDNNKKSSSTDIPDNHAKHKRPVKRFFALLATIINLGFTFLFGTTVFYHFSLIFDPVHVASQEIAMTVASILLVLLGIVGSYFSLFLLFIDTKFESLFSIFK